jgi:hypothetical protein
MIQAATAVMTTATSTITPRTISVSADMSGMEAPALVTVRI